MKDLSITGKVFAHLLGAAVLLGGSAGHARASACDARLAEQIPPRAASAPGGHAIAGTIAALDGEAREEFLREQVLAGNVPHFLRQLEPVELAGPAGPNVTLCVMPDYLAVGTNEDYLLVPMRLETALEIGQRLGFLLPTPKVVDEISRQSRVHLTPQPLPASDQMRSSAYLIEHNALVREQRERSADPLGALTSGDKKDLVLTNRLWTQLERVAIYGWHAIDGRPIQPLSTVHGWHYVDYSHGVRLVSERVLIDGHPRALLDALADPSIAPLLSSEGVIVEIRALIERLKAARAAATHS